MAHNLFISNFNMNKQVLKLFKKGIIIIMVIFLLDRGIGFVIKYCFAMEKQGDSFVTTYALTRATEDVIILGSSRASHHYIPLVFKEKANLTAFNAGRDGMNLSYYLAVLQGLLVHHTPKVIIFDLNLNDLTLNNEKEDEMISSLLPYINENPAVKRIIEDVNPMELWKAQISMLYRFNSLPVSILQHYIGFGQENINGYEPLFGNNLKSIPDTMAENDNYREDAVLINKFEEFITTVKNKSVSLYVVVSPNSKKNKFSSKVTASRILARYGLKLHDYSEFSGPNRLALFYDGTHLNDTGARLFTEAFVSDLMMIEQRTQIKDDGARNSELKRICLYSLFLVP